MWRMLMGQEDSSEQEESKLVEQTPNKNTGEETPTSKKKEKKAKMAEKELKPLVNKRGQVKAKLTRIWTALQVEEGAQLTISQQQLRVHARNVEKYYTEYNDVHDKITSLAPDEQAELNEGKLVEFEQLYNNTLVLIETLLDAHTRAAAPPPGNQVVGLVPPGQPQYVIHQQSLKAPLPTFNGKYENWPKFKSMFVDLMRNSPDSDAVKLFHLEKALVGEAEGILDAKTIQDNNYQQAWRILEERYENKRRIIDIHIEGILQLKKVAKKSSKELRELINECTRHVENLRFHGQDLTGVSELIVVHILASALDSETRELWEGTIEHGELPEYEETMDFLKKRCLILERCEMSKPVVSTAKPAVAKGSMAVKSSTKVSAAVSTNSEVVCELCGGPHVNFKCSAFRNMSVAQRYAKVKQARVCFNCLRKGHRSSACTSERSCSKCSAKHHGLLHPEEEQSQQPPSSKQEEKVGGAAQSTGSEQPIDSTPVESSTKNSASVTTSCHSGGMLQSTKQVLLQTAIIDVVDKYGRLHPCRTLLDSGSQAHILSESMARVLGLPAMKCNITVVGANAAKTQARKGVNVEFSSRYSNYRDRIECLISDRPTGTVPTATINVKEWNIPSEIQLADPRFFEPNEVDLILASNYVWELLRTNTLKLSNGTTSLRETDLGWIVTGTYDPYVQVSPSILLSNVTIRDSLQAAVEKFWTVEEVGDSSPYSNEEEEVEAHFLKTSRRDDTGRFVVQMPFKDTVSELDDNREQALKRFFQLEKRLASNQELKRQYTDFIEEYEVLGHCQEVQEQDDVPGTKRYYLPHHAVLKPSSSSTKLRVVFNASSKSGKYSLNDVLMTGPTVQSDLFSILLRFRSYKYAFSGDVAKMYRQVRIDGSQTAFLRIFWRKDPSDPIRVLELKTVTYGTSSAPYLATRCLVQLAEEEKERFPVAADMLKKDVYVDDLLSGADTEEDAVERQRAVTELLAEAGFPIRKWCSNSPAVMKNVPEEDQEKLIRIKECSEATKALGVLWDPREDKLLFVDECKEEDKKITKRYVLSTIAKLFDPLGLVSPVVVLAKMTMQKLWACRVNWDDELGGEILKEWETFQRSMPTLTEISVPRCMVSAAVRLELHGFADASLAAYGACIYLRCIKEDGSATASLMCAKSRVAPLSGVTIPKMELLAALLLSRLVKKVTSTVQMTFSATVLWSDNQIVLAWLKRAPGTLEVFVRNRVVQINDITAGSTWKYVNTTENPADIVSRGQLPSPLSKNTLWWHGPAFLQQPEYVVEEPSPLPESEIPGLKKIVVAASVCIEQMLPVFSRFSDFRKLQRVIAYVHRFVSNCRSRATGQPKIVSEYATVPEMKKSLKCIVMVVQMLELQDEIRAAESGEPSKHLAALNPFLDRDNLLRVGGRLENADLPFETKHQLILPPHPVTDTLIRTLHVENMHVGPTGLLAIIRRQFWLLRGRSAVRKVTRRCLNCFRVKPSKIQQLMGSLPEERVNIAAPFEYTGVDYAGPVTVKQGKYRPKLVKGYIAVFVCMATKNVHLELVSELTTEAFLAALERFVNRRGLVRKMFSDNGTNFVGASHELHELYQQLQADIHRQGINNLLVPKEIEWHFIPPRAPNFGGLWEAGVKSTKTHLKRTLQNAILTFEEFATALTHVEAILNSRPLFNLTDNPSDPMPISPAQLQIGRPLQSIPKPSCRDVPKNRLTRWRYLDQLKEHFWNRWSREYLTTLQTRGKWTSKTSSVQPGTVVLLIEDNLPPQTWKLGIVTKTYPGKDSLVRVVDVRTSAGNFKRSISKLAPLPLEDNDDLLNYFKSSASQPRGRMFVENPSATVDDLT